MSERRPGKRKICKRCNGEGDVQGYEYGGFPAMFTCKACDGKGYLLIPARVAAEERPHG